MSDVLALIRDPVEQKRVRLMVSERMSFIDDLDDVWDRLETRRPSVLVIELGGPDRARVLDTIGELRVLFPTLPIVGYCQLTRAIAREIIQAVHAGITDVALRDFHDLPVCIRAATGGSNVEKASRHALHHLFAELPRKFHTLAEQCVRQSRGAMRVEDVAAAMGVPARTLLRQLERAGLPSPGTLIALSKLLVAAHLMQDQNETVAEVSARISMASSFSFRELLRRHTGMTPTEVRREGGLEQVLSSFRRTMRRGSALPTETSSVQRQLVTQPK